MAPAAWSSMDGAVKETECPPTTMAQLRQQALGCLGEIDDFGDVGQVVAGEGDRVGAPGAYLGEVGAVVLGLQVHDADGVPVPLGGGGHQFQAERFEAEKHLGVHERTGVDGQQLHLRLRASAFANMRRSAAAA